MNHIVERRNLLLWVANDGEVDRRTLRIFNVSDPLIVLLHGVDRDHQSFSTPRRQLVFEFRCVAQLRRANRREISRVRKEHHPVISNPVMEPNAPLRCVGFKVGGGVAEQQAHQRSPCK